MVKVLSRQPPAFARRCRFRTSGHFHAPVSCGEHPKHCGCVLHFLEGHDVRVDLPDTAGDGVVVCLNPGNAACGVRVVQMLQVPGGDAQSIQRVWESQFLEATEQQQDADQDDGKRGLPAHAEFASGTSLTGFLRGRRCSGLLCLAFLSGKDRIELEPGAIKPTRPPLQGRHASPARQGGLRAGGYG